MALFDLFYFILNSVFQLIKKKFYHFTITPPSFDLPVAKSYDFISEYQLSTAD
jgi:hypothetical protein